jgi:hypothetical protein
LKYSPLESDASFQLFTELWLEQFKQDQPFTTITFKTYFNIIVPFMSKFLSDFFPQGCQTKMLNMFTCCPYIYIYIIKKKTTAAVKLPIATVLKNYEHPLTEK